MAALDLLPSTTYQPPSSGLAHRRRRSLNTIIEDDEDSNRGGAFIDMRGRDRSSKNRSPTMRSPKNRSPKANWLSPLSDHFPTPRGNHFMSASIPYSSESSDSESNSPAPSSAPWTRNSYSTNATEFDDLYDVSSDEDERQKTAMRRNSNRQTTKTDRSAGATTGNRAALPALVIPSGGDPWPGITNFKAMTSPASVPPTPPPKVPMSPAILQYLQSQEVPSCSAPPSLDGSLTSDQMALMSAPPTPMLDNGSDCGENNWGSGVQLQPDAMATLQALSGGDDFYDHQHQEQVISLEHVSPHESPVREMQQSLPPLITNIHRNDSIVLSPEQQRSLNSLTRLEIPSPGGFFSTLSSGARHTWHLVAATPESALPPSSTTAEHFYKTPWSSAPVERIIEVPETMSDELPTARPILNKETSGLTVRPEPGRVDSDDTITGLPASSPVEEDIVADEILGDYETGYARKLEDVAISNFDRTGLWLAAQSSYLSELINPTEDHDDEVNLLQRQASVKSQKEEIESPPRKTVRFSEIVATSVLPTTGDIACPVPKIDRQESTYYRAFQHFVGRSRYRDTFVHRTPRFEAMQAQRVSFPAVHRAQLLGKYQLSVVPMSVKRRISANVARGDEIAPEDPEKLKRDKEYEAITQMSPATWNIMAIKLLNGGRLIAAPVAKRIARLSSMGPMLDGTPRDRARILDLGGQATCDWAWHCASEYPNTKVYTVTTKALRQLSNSNIRGPKNHRQVAVDRLVKLPFKDNQFDLISARDIYMILREQGENGEDEWESCLKECMRILKPGGYLEFSVMDSDIVNAGPAGLAKSVEFGFNLKTLGYDPAPTKLWLSRLKNAGFVGIKRAWVFLPMGAKVNNKVAARDSMGVEVKLELEAMVTGNTESSASVCGIVGGWSWEKWLLRCRVQTVGDVGILEGVQDIIEEGRACGAGWRTLSGWARKPLGKM
jgi:SAM-dependent methyltransferase